MSNRNGKICRLCLKLVFESDTDMTEEVTKYMLEELLLKLNLEITVRPIMCDECAKNLQQSFDFKIKCLSENNTLPFIQLIENNHQECTEVFKDDNLCHICKSKEKCLTALYESKENVLMFDILQKHLPELNLDDTEKVVLCTTCLESVQVLFKFVTNCLNMEEKIKNYVVLNRTNYKGQVNLKDIKQFTFKMPRNDEIERKDKIILKGEVKNADFMEIDKIKCTEEDTIKIGQENKSFDDSTQSPSKRWKNINKSNQCSLGMQHKRSLKRRSIKGGSSFTTIDGSTGFSYEIKFKEQSDGTSSIMPVYKCKLCSFETQFKNNLLEWHMVVHQVPSGAQVFRCEMCAFKTKHEENLKKHLLNHPNVEKTKHFECSDCTYKAKSKYAFKKHMLRHEKSE